MAAMSLNSVTTQCEGTLPWAWQAEAISSLARSTSGCMNWPWLLMASAGIAPPWAETKSIRPKLSDCTRGCAAISKALCTASGDSISTCSGRGPADAALSACSALITSAMDSTLGTMMCESLRPALPAMRAMSASNAGWSTACTRTATRALPSDSLLASSASATTMAACSASPPTGAPSSQSSVTSKTQAPNSSIMSACSCRLLRIRASTPL